MCWYLQPLFLFQDAVIDHIGGDGTGTLTVPSGYTLQLALAHTKTFIQSSLAIAGDVVFPPTVYTEQTTSNTGRMIGVEHWYTRGYTRLEAVGQSMCTRTESHPGIYYFHSFTVLTDGEFNFYDESEYDVDLGMEVHTHVFHMEGSAQGSITKTAYLVGVWFELEHGAEIDGTGLGYEVNDGPGPGCAGGSSGCGSGGSHGGRGGSCSGCYSCSSGATYGSAIIPSQAGSGGGTSSYNNGGAGGSSVRLVHVMTVIDGVVQMNGQTTSGGGGGGAGGSAWIDGEVIDGRGYVYAVGGGAGTDGCSYSCCNKGGGGGGGRVRAYGRDYTSTALLHQRYVTGGIGAGSTGGTGSKHQSPSNHCSGHGTFNDISQVCVCNHGHVGDDCQYLCADNTTCGEHGTCDSRGLCQCDTGYVGDNCESQCTRETSCSGHGDCSRCGYCICDPCYSGPDCSIECSGAGECVAGSCLCNNCSLGRLCESECNQHGTCVTDKGDLHCECADYWNGDKCTERGCPGIEEDCSGHGICNTGSGQCFCSVGWFGKLQA